MMTEFTQPPPTLLARPGARVVGASIHQTWLSQQTHPQSEVLHFFGILTTCSEYWPRKAIL